MVVYLADMTLTRSEVRVIGVAFVKSLVRLWAVYTSALYTRACTHACVPIRHISMYGCMRAITRSFVYVGVYFVSIIRTTPRVNEQMQAIV